MKHQEKLVKDVLGIANSFNDLSVDKINEMAPKEQEKAPQVELSKKEIARMEGIPYIEPYKKLQAFGTLTAEMKPKRDHDWEYVKGMFDNEVVRGEPFRFTLSKWPGDPDCFWEVPANRPVYVPRMIAKHLSGEQENDTGIVCMIYHEFIDIPKSDNQLRKDDFTHQFTPIRTVSRGKFRAIGAF